MNQDRNQSAIYKPFFSIGVPTYHRKDLLKQTLLSILKQTFTDFDVIVMNDFPDETISHKIFGIEDPRIRFFNHKHNIGELENMNSLLNFAQGRYFTWIFDDDPCAPTFLSEVNSALTKFNFPLAVYTAYTSIYGTGTHRFKKSYDGQSVLFSGRDFLKSYLSGRLKVLGCSGCYNTYYLKSIGGVQKLTNGLMALHSEYLLLIRSGLLSEIAYIYAPLVSCRIHENSWSCSNNEVELFKQGGINLIRESMKVFLQDELKEDFFENLSSILKSVISSVVVKIIMYSNQLDTREIQQYIALIEKEFNPLKGSAFYTNAISSLNTAYKNMPWYISKARIKMLLPHRYLKFVHMVLSTVSRYSNKSF